MHCCQVCKEVKKLCSGWEEVICQSFASSRAYHPDEHTHAHNCKVWMLHMLRKPSVLVQSQVWIPEIHLYPSISWKHPPCKLWMPHVSRRPMCLFKAGVRYWNPSTDRAPAARPTTMDPAGVIGSVQAAPCATNHSISSEKVGIYWATRVPAHHYGPLRFHGLQASCTADPAVEAKQ